MKTNIQSLMNKISEEEKKVSNIAYVIKSHIVSTSIQELDGRVTITEDFKEDFQKELKELEEANEKVCYYKRVLYEKNNSFKLSDGRTIQAAIVENTQLRSLKQSYETFLPYKNRKSRVSESHDAYFECRTINFNREEIEEKIKKLEEKIQQTDFEISKLNSKEFELD